MQANRHRVTVKAVDTIADRVGFVHSRINQRAYELFLKSRGPRDMILAHLQEAEKELIHAPEAAVRQCAHGVCVKIPCPQLDPAHLKLFSTPYELLVLGPLPPESGGRWLCCVVRFPLAIDAEDASCEYVANDIYFTASLPSLPEEQKMHPRTP